MKSSRTWVLSIPFVSAPGLTFEEEVSAMVPGGTIQMRPATPPYNRLVVEGLQTVDDARSMFSSLRRGFLAGSVSVGCGIQVKDDLVVLDDATRPPNDLAQPLTYQEGKNLRQAVITFGEPEYQVPRVLPKLLEGLRFGLSSPTAARATQDSVIALACELYTNSFFERSSQARFISFIGVLEVLKDKGSSSAEAIQLINRWVNDLDGLERDEAKSFQGRLNFLKQASVTQGVRDVVERHLGSDRAHQAARLYNIRSKLVHDGKRPAHLEDSLGLATVIVRQLLASILKCGSR